MNSVQSTGHTGSMSKKDQLEVIAHFHFYLNFSCSIAVESCLSEANT